MTRNLAFFLGGIVMVVFFLTLYCIANGCSYDAPQNISARSKQSSAKQYGLHTNSEGEEDETQRSIEMPASWKKIYRTNIRYLNEFENDVKMYDVTHLNDHPIKIKKITLVDFNENHILATKGEKTLFATTTVPDILMIAARASSMLLQEMVPPGTDGAPGTQAYIGTLKIHTTDKIIAIGISKHGFFYGTEGPTLRSIFYSWAYAKILAELVMEATDEETHISHTLFSTLSGQSVIDVNKAVYWREKQKVAQMGEAPGMR